ncbi:hypothetical protein M405DRAFT_449068 [Rhizopogon salebrosus TDB-379]|nr:hypothetical protein M405DRAFT_449068 [Rhizopogon salebrosus TDB-379]
MFIMMNCLTAVLLVFQKILRKSLFRSQANLWVKTSTEESGLRIDTDSSATYSPTTLSLGATPVASFMHQKRIGQFASWCFKHRIHCQSRQPHCPGIAALRQATISWIHIFCLLVRSAFSSHILTHLLTAPIATTWRTTKDSTLQSLLHTSETPSMGTFGSPQASDLKHTIRSTRRSYGAETTRTLGMAM